MKEHAEAFGVKFTREEVKSVDFSGDIKVIKTKKNEYQAKAVILATGTESRKLGIPGEKELTGQGVKQQPCYCTFGAVEESRQRI